MSDARERTTDPTETGNAANDGLQAKLWTSTIAIVESYDAAKGTITARPAIKSSVIKPDGTVEQVELPMLQDVPVVTPGGSSGGIVPAYKKGDSVLINFVSRNFDGWHQNGDVQSPPDARMNDPSDGIVVGRVKTAKESAATTNPSSDNPQLRTDDGKLIVELDQAKSQVRVMVEGIAYIVVDKDKVAMKKKGSTTLHLTVDIKNNKISSGMALVTEPDPYPGD